jgi:MraZ protein
MDLESILGGGLLLGTYTPKLDDKNRLLLPAKFRDRFAPGLVMTRGQNRCVYLVPLDEFAKFYEKLKGALATDRKGQDYLRVMLSGANDDVPDKQGRLSIPLHLREYAGLDRDVAVIGAGNIVEVWDRQAWDAYLAANESAYAEAGANTFPDLAF